MKHHLEHFHEMNTMTRRTKFLLLSLMPWYFIIIGLVVQPLPEILPGLLRIMVEPDLLITDYFAVGGIGAATINAGLITLICLAMVYFMGMEMSGHTITATFLMFGFSLFGKNLMNIWAILAGVFLYSKYHKTSFQRYFYIGLYGTSLSPIMTQMMRLGHFPVPVRLLIALAVGIAIGFVLPPLSTHVHYAHKGYSLYNVGFAAGIIATVVVSLAKSFGLEIESRLIWSEGNQILFGVLLALLFGVMIAAGVAVRGKTIWESYMRVSRDPGLAGADFFKAEGGATTVFNMGINGLFATFFVLAVGGDMNGPTICGILTIVGFSSTGKHIRNIAPVMLGVYLASFTKNWALNDPAPILALLLSTTLAPVAGQFGAVAGLLAGYLHSSVALQVGVIYGGMNLYNNGFAGGIVAIFLVPVIQSISDRRARARGGLSL